MRIVDKNWNRIFEEHNVLDKIARDGRYVITATEINRYKEARLMTKWDQETHLPVIFQKNRLSILPTKRGEYVIGDFKAYQSLPVKIDEQPTELDSPPLESLNKNNLYSEASALLYGYNSGMFDDFLHEESYMTVSGRMTSGSFDFQISATDTKSSSAISVSNSQIEIDAGIETRNQFAIIEAKNIRPTDFLVRQLYYPYRLWKNKLKKEVVPIFLSYSDDVFYVHQFKFLIPDHYNSLVMVKQKSYTTQKERITLDDFVRLWKNTKLVPAPQEVPFPQADSFERVLDILSILSKGPQTAEEVQLEFMLDIRQAHYYLSAALFLHLIQREKDGNRYIFSLLPETEAIMEKRYHDRILYMAQRIIENVVFSKAFSYRLIEGSPMSREDVKRLFIKYNVDIGESTINRRASTVMSWVAWIYGKIHK